jgi:hypothetical protein
MVMWNIAATPIELAAYVSNVINSTNGGFSLDEPGVELVAPATWIGFDPEIVTLETNQEASRSITISVPEGTSPGQYVAGLAVQTADSLAVEGGDTFRQVLRKLMPVVITVPGPVEVAFEVGTPELVAAGDLMSLRALISNTGNTMVAPAGTLTISDANGNIVTTGDVAMQPVYAFHDVNLEISIGTSLPPGDYTVSLELADALSGTVASSFPRNVVIAAPEIVAASAETPVVFANVSITPNADPIQFADVVVEVENIGPPVASASLVLVVSHDGQAVEEFLIADRTPVEQGINQYATRYIPATGFTTGVWEFSLRLESADGSGVTTTLALAEQVAIITVP